MCVLRASSGDARPHTCDASGDQQRAWRVMSVRVCEHELVMCIGGKVDGREWHVAKETRFRALQVTLQKHVRHMQLDGQWFNGAD